jgi:hypothetical protein
MKTQLHEKDFLAWTQARRGAEKAFQAYGEQVETPAECPYTLDQVMDGDFLPGMGKR